MKYEILAPAGSMESLIAGVRSGADAVYLGGKLFNARRNAGNFDDEQLNKAVEYCHSRGVKVYLTLNILLSDSELEAAYELIKGALEAGVDAFIIQDIGVARMIKECFPEARLHASTQMSIMTPEGVKQAERAGFSRVVLPREMSLDEIREISSSADIELELFVHGALCMCVSGQCYMSSVLGSRSGNRGLCAQPCRLPFTAGGENSYALSLKDLSLVKHLGELDGITSLKIEGRMKRPEYVSAAVTALKKAVKGEYTASDEFTLRSVFSRSGFTDGYFTAKRGRDMFGTRQKEDVISASQVLKEISHSYDNENPLLPIDMKFVCRSGQPAVLTVCALGKTVTVKSDTPERAINKPMTEGALRERLSKLGGTQFFANSIEIELDDGLILPVSKINELRRRAVEAVSTTQRRQVNAMPFAAPRPIFKSGAPYATASFRSASQIPDRHSFKRVFIPLDSPLEDFIDNRAGAVLPRAPFGQEEKLIKQLERIKKAGVRRVLSGNIGAYRLAEAMGFEMFADFGLNIFNSISANEFSSPVLSFELSLEQANRINASDTGILAYGYIPLMITRNCPVKNDIGCIRCGGNGRLTDRKGYEFPVICSDYPCSEILNSVPLYMLDRVNEIKTDFIHFNFTIESMHEVEKIIGLYESGGKPDFKYTRGLYKRGLL